MAERLLRLTRLTGGSGRGPVLVNLGTVAWLEGDAGGGTRIVFAGAAGAEEALVVTESFEEIGRLANAAGTTDEEAIAQAWADQTALRGGDEDEEPST
jgi:hypothetical protein